MERIYVIMMGTDTVVGVVRNPEPFVDALKHIGCVVGFQTGKKRIVENRNGELIATIFEAGIETL